MFTKNPSNIAYAIQASYSALRFFNHSSESFHTKYGSRGTT
ncbi:hypothetical protein ACJONO_06220 [Mycoplasmopsis synoviae]